MNPIFTRSLFVVLAVVVTLGLFATAGYAQYGTCVTETVAYQPVAAAPVRQGWYPGKLLDKMRLRNWGFGSAAAPTYTTAYASSYYNPAYTTNYAPYTAAYAPVSSVAYQSRAYRQAAYRPYVTAYAPLAVPTTLHRQVTLRPVTSSCCTTCYADPCGCSGGVNQAAYTEPFSGTSSDCSGCAPASSGPDYSAVPSAGPSTGQPGLTPDYAAPPEKDYRTNKLETSEEGSDTGSGETSGADETEQDTQSESDTSTFFEAPPLFLPNDSTARRSGKNSPSVDVRPAVYRKPVTQKPIGNRTGRTRPQVEVITNGWQAVSR